MFRNYLKNLILFGTLFALASLILFLTFYFNEDLPFPRYDPQPPQRPGEPLEFVDWLPIILSVVTAVISAGGFLFTTIFAFRQDRRATQLHSFELERLKQELQQKELEIERLNRQLREITDD